MSYLDFFFPPCNHFVHLQGLPEDGDAAGARLQDNGELVFNPKLKSDALVAATQSKPEDRRDYLDTDTVKKHLRLKWLMPYWFRYECNTSTLIVLYILVEYFPYVENGYRQSQTFPTIL